MSEDIETTEAEDKIKVQVELDETFDKRLLKMLKSGVKVYDAKTQKVVKIDAPHQYFEIARKRLADLGMTKEVAAGSSEDEMAQRLGFKNPEVLEMPKMSGGPDAATG